MDPSEEDDLLDELFPKVSDEQTNCLLAFVNKILQFPFDPVGFELAVNSFRAAIPNPIPTVFEEVRETANGVLTRVLIWIYLFTVFAILVLVWLLAGSGSLSWQNALIFTVFMALLTLFVLMVTKHLVSIYVTRKENQINQYIGDWIALYAPQIPAAINEAICIYANHPGPPPSSQAENTCNTGMCGGGTYEDKKRI